MPSVTQRLVKFRTTRNSQQSVGLEDGLPPVTRSRRNQPVASGSSVTIEDQPLLEPLGNNPVTPISTPRKSTSSRGSRTPQSNSQSEQNQSDQMADNPLNPQADPFNPPGEPNNFEQPDQGGQENPDQNANGPPGPPDNNPPGPDPNENQGPDENMNHGQAHNAPAPAGLAPIVNPGYAHIDPAHLATAAAAAIGAAVRGTGQPPRKYLPTPDCREAPVFVASKPRDLLRFLKRYEDLCRQCRITDHQEKIENVTQYADAQTESEWQAFESYRNGTWEEFKEELISSYPEAIDHEEGSVEQLEKVCRNNMRIGITDQSALMQLKREFMAEVAKLTRTNPPIISNQSLVRLFFGCLDSGFRDSLVQRLQIQTVNPVAAGRRRDDLYDLDLVVKTALEMANGAAGQSFGRQYLGSESKRSVAPDLAPIKTEVDTLRQDVAGMKDLLTIGAQRQKVEYEQIMKALQQKAAQPMGANVQNSQPRTYNNNPNPPRDQGCFFCGEPGHFVSNCLSRQQMLDTGRLKMSNGRYTLANGSEIKKTNQGTWKERIEAQESSLSANYFDSLFYHGMDNQGSAGPSYEPSVAQLKQEMDFLKSQLMASGGLNYNSQGEINTAYQPSASQRIANGEPPTILKRDPRNQYVNTRTGAGNDQGF